jgi:hypothetical protein
MTERSLIEMGLTKTGCGDMTWIELAQDCKRTNFGISGVVISSLLPEVGSYLVEIIIL